MNVRYYITEKRLKEKRETEKTIKRLWGSGMSIIDISDKLGIAEATVHNCLK